MLLGTHIQEGGPFQLQPLTEVSRRWVTENEFQDTQSPIKKVSPPFLHSLRGAMDFSPGLLNLAPVDIVTGKPVTSFNTL